MKEKASTNLKTVFGSGNSAIIAEKMYFPVQTGSARPAWRVIVPGGEASYLVVVDAETGTLLWRSNLTAHQSEPVTYNVYANSSNMVRALDSPAPLRPGPVDPNLGTQGPLRNRTNVTLIGNEGANSFNNLGWINDGDNTTEGNNVIAGISCCSPYGIFPPISGSGNRVFSFNYTPSHPAGAGDDPHSSEFQKGSVTTVFYLSNRYHDEVYKLGFTEQARNFQKNNFGRGGTADDPVIAEVQDITERCVFTNRPDGTSPIMEIGVLQAGNQLRDSNFNADTVLHELTHGLVDRLMGDGKGSGFSHMGEGWADFYAESLLSEPTDPINGVYAFSPYKMYGETAGNGGLGNYYYGDRLFPKAVITAKGGANNRPHNPLTFADIDTAQVNLSDGAFPSNGVPNFGFPHFRGEVWSSALWEVRARLISRLGHAEGNRRTLQFVTDGLKLTPLTGPTFLQGRDAIMQAAVASGTADDLLDVRIGFAIRGMGDAATQVGFTVVESFVPAPPVAPAAEIANNPLTIVSETVSPANTAPDPGETLTVSVPLQNYGNANSGANVTVTLLSTGGITNPSAAQNYGMLTAGGPAVSRNFTFDVPVSTVPGSQITLTFQVQDGATSFQFVQNYTVAAALIINDPLTITNETVLPPNNAPDPNETLTVSVGLRNYGNASSAPNVTVTLLNSGGITNPSAAQDYGTLAVAGASVSRNFTFDVPGSTVPGSQITLTFQVQNGTISTQLFKNYTVGAPNLVHNALTIVNESIAPGNNAPDPNETVTVSVPLRNLGNAASGANTTVTLLNSGGITNPSAPQNYGSLAAGGTAVSRNFTFSVPSSAACASLITLSFQVNDGTTSTNFIETYALGARVLTNSENFDGVTAPALPSGWSPTLTGGGTAWLTSAVAGSIGTSPPNVARASELSVDQYGYSDLESPVWNVSSSKGRLQFNITYSIHPQMGAVLEIKIGAGQYQDIIAAGGKFNSGGYNREILDLPSGHPISTRRAWAGSSGGNVASSVDLPAAAQGQTVRFRWRLATHSSASSTVVLLDDVQLFGANACAATPTTTAVSKDPAGDSFVGDNVTFTATVTSGGNPVTTGTVTFTEGAATLASNVALNGSGQASFVTTALTEGSHTIIATYNPAAGFATSNGSISHTVNTPTVISGNTFTNPGTITVADGIGGTTASPYPSNIAVSGVSGPITKVTLALNGLNLASPDDVDMLLVAPTGEKFVPFSHVGGLTPASAVNLVLDDAAASFMPDSSALSSGTFRPTAFSTSGVQFPAPAPAGPYGFAATAGAVTLASSFNGIDPNGTWKLFVTTRGGGARPDAERPEGAIGGGSIGSWGLTFTLPAPTNPSGVGAANPVVVPSGGSTLLTVAVTPGANPTSSGIGVTGDLTTIGGSATQAFSDNGSGGDVAAGDNTFSYNATVGGGTTTGAKSIPASISDAQSRNGNATINLTVCTTITTVTNTNDSGAGSLRQAVIDACPGSTITFAPGLETSEAERTESPDLAGFIDLTSGEIAINKNLIITGPGANLLTVRRSTAGGTPDFRVFNIGAGSTVTISGLTISNGRLTGATSPNPFIAQGAGIFNSGNLTLLDSAISGNNIVVLGEGGGIHNSGTLTVSGSTFNGNTIGNVQGSGGGIFNSGTLTVTNSTFSGNSAEIGGGGIFSTGTMNLRNSTITANTTNSLGGGIRVSGTVNITSSILAGNTSTFANPDLTGSVTSQSYNIIGSNQGSNVLVGLPDANNSYVGGPPGAPVVAGLGPLQYNGGTTQTHALLVGSIAIDKGSNALNLTTDQRGIGFPRAVDQPSITNATTGGPDIGAFEYGDTVPPTVTSMDDGDADNSIGINTMLTFTVTFSEDIDGATVTAGDFNNVGTAMVTIGTVTEGTPGVVSVEVTPTTTGTIILQIPTGAVISDLVGNNLIVPVQDNDTVNVVAETTAVVDGSGNLVITDTNGGTSNDNLTISCTTSPPPTMVVISVPGNSLNQSFELSSITGSITVNTLGGNDTLTLDLAGCNFTAGGVIFNGGDPTTGPGDKLVILGGSTTTQTFNFTNEHDGSVVLEGGGRTGTINYTGLEPVSSTVNAANVVLNYSTTTEVITVIADGVDPTLTKVDSNVGGETVSFVNPTTSLTINGGDTGNDTINVNGFGTSGGGFTAGLTINGGTGNDTVNLNADINFASGNSLDVDLQNDLLPALTLPGTDTINVGINANLVLTGTGAAVLTASRDIAMASDSSVTTVDGGLTIEANQQAVPTPGYFYAVSLVGATLQTSGSGNVSVKGKGGSDTATQPIGSVGTIGVSLDDFAAIRSTSSSANAGLITINGVGGNAGETGTHGASFDTSSIITSVSGDISITGTAGNTLGQPGRIVSVGVRNFDGSSISSSGTGPNAASITIHGTAGNATTSGSVYGTELAGSLTSVDGAVNVTGIGGNAVSAAGALGSAGVLAGAGGSISSTGTGANAASLTILGTSGNVTNAASQGFRQDSSIITVDGDLSIAGTAGNGNSGNTGSSVRANITATGDANIAITGTGGNSSSANRPNNGVHVRGGAVVSTATGAITVTGTGGNTADNAGFSLGPISGTGQLNSTGGNITVNADTIAINTTNGTINAGANSVSLRQKTAGHLINLGSSVDSTANTLELSDAELDRITAGTLNIGNATSGPITVSADITRTAATNMTLVSDGDVIISGGQIDTGGGTLLLDPGISPFAVKPTKSLTDVAASTLSFGSDLAIVINGTTVDTQYTQLNVVGAVNLTGVSLVLSGTHVPTAGQQFTIVNNDGGDAIVGTFNGLAQGATISNFLGAPGVNATISYTGGTSNDVVLTVDNVPPTVTSTTPLQGAINVDRNGNITLNFSETVNILAGGVTVNCGGAEAFSPTLPQNGVTSIVIDPTNTLPAGVLCTVTGVSANIADPAGNQLDGDGNGSAGPDFALNFTTACTTNPMVVTNGDSGVGSLREAVDVACPGSTITFAAPVTGTIDLLSSIAFNKSLIIDGPGANVLNIRRNVPAAFRIFTISGNPNVTVSDLTISNGDAGASFGGGIYSTGGNLTLDAVAIAANKAANGGGISKSLGSLIIRNSTISGNTSQFQAGGINTFDLASMTVVNSTISGNTCNSQGGGILFAETGGGTFPLTIVNSTITNNTAGPEGNSSGGGGISIFSQATPGPTIRRGSGIRSSPEIRQRTSRSIWMADQPMRYIFQTVITWMATARAAL